MSILERPRVERSEEFISRVLGTGCYSFDAEHPPELSLYDSNFRLAGMGFATRDMFFYEIDIPTIAIIIKELFATGAEAVAYNAKYDLQCLVASKIITQYDYPKNLRDPMIAVNLLNENIHPKDLGLKSVVEDRYKYKMSDFKTAWAHGEKSPEFRAYALDDAKYEFRLYQDLKPKLKQENLWDLFTKILMESTKVVADMEYMGVGWDIKEARRLLRGYQVLRKQLQEEIYDKIGVLNINSGDQIATRLFDELKYSTRGIPMTDSGKRVSTGKAAMDKLAVKYPVCDKIRNYKTADKMISTYIEPLTRRALVNKESRIHPSFWLVSTTGRSRCEKPSFQTIPARLDKRFSDLSIRNAIVPKPGWKLLVCDQSNVELRICAHVTEDPTFLKAYREWQCRNCGETGSESNKVLHECPNCGAVENEEILKEKNADGFWHGLDLHTLTTQRVSALRGNRDSGKACNFALIYYATAYRMHMEYPDFSIDEWEDIIREYFEEYQGVRAWHLQSENQMRATGVNISIFGRKRRIPPKEIHRSQKAYKHCLNQFINFRIQASAGELIQLIMCELRNRWIQSRDWITNIYQSNFVHDEAIYECPEDRVDEFSADIIDAMENTIHLRVPLRCNLKVVDKWGSAK